MSNEVHFRRCHVCGAVNESTGSKVDRCHSCHKSLAPFYYFDDRMTMVLADTTVRPDSPPPDEYYPIQGLTAYWESL